MKKLDIDELNELDDKLKRYFSDGGDPEELIYRLYHCLMDVIYSYDELLNEYTDLIQDYDYKSVKALGDYSGLMKHMMEAKLERSSDE